MTEQEAKRIIKQYWELVDKAAEKLRGTVIPEDKCDWIDGYEINSIADLFISTRDGSIRATVLPYAPDEAFYVDIPSDAFEEF